MAIVLASLCFATSAGNCIVGGACEGRDETNLIQIQRHLHVGSQRAEKYINTQAASEGQVARLIGSNSGITPIQANKISTLLNDYSQVDWDGDTVVAGTFAGVLAVGSKPFIEKNLVDPDKKYDDGKLESPSRRAIAHCSLANKNYCPNKGEPSDDPNAVGFQVMSEKETTDGSNAITSAMQGGSWEQLLNDPKPNAQYLSLAAADIAASPPATIFWAYDDDRDSTTYASWISLAEWYAFCDKYPYTIVNHAGQVVVPDTSKKPWSVTASDMGWGTKDTPCVPIASE